MNQLRITMQNLLSQSYKDVLKLQRVRHFGPFYPDASRIDVLRLMMESAGQSDGATPMCHHFTRSSLHNHGSSVILWKERRSRENWLSLFRCYLWNIFSNIPDVFKIFFYMQVYG